MLIVMEKTATPEQIENVVSIIEQKGYTPRPIPGGERVAIGVLRNKGPVDAALFLGIPGVKDTVPITRPYKLVSRETQPEDTIVTVGDVAIGNGRLTLMAGPCAIESELQALTIAEKVKAAGAHIFRGGAFKPRTSPYAFQGMGEEGLKIMARVREVTGMPIVTEVMDDQTFDLVEAYADIIQIGTRNMQNFSLLKRAGRSRKPIFLKRGLAATIDEWLMAAEYILEGGNTQVILCERGVRTFVNHSRNTLDVSAVPVVRKESHLPIIIDPSHAGGRRDQVIPLSRAAVAVGAHGLMVEVHHEPDKAMSDGAQSLYPEQFVSLCRQVDAIFRILQNGTDAI
ncbi:3-deoxy-7-phosphoheptulonate synthase [Desulfococcus multivorans]|uniref:Phospho-2-dehydro-3-deoxyheptonate aldolase n=1 Tax=Desulfococcus multivorans DSM 2059 TaxID=1121405 RepID=S7V4L9_DESML|nr:3-deoxy-7-phosphoheptulonate synthase [Desulfococcus multivorans]AOY58601.1 AroF: phospho-2-dehydro-3-deoxyheptonate aldolase [Desulfococcus multivorans]AQV00903.1 3-deoxy-7-phosphoheptulonate synthase [Desulfococcus multivorans]EPR41549.1 phospho-2-dehydro-3-deoxyheptonate aldolase [Desulfococcus multivorans DSM 2059]SJZ44430.1 3-deoxy-D-arabinoheptulosonate-7-phosphate synthase [Desulfococcus multivorans DSM 2059]